MTVGELRSRAKSQSSGGGTVRRNFRNQPVKDAPRRAWPSRHRIAGHRVRRVCSPRLGAARSEPLGEIIRTDNKIRRRPSTWTMVRYHAFPATPGTELERCFRFTLDRMAAEGDEGPDFSILKDLPAISMGLGTRLQNKTAELPAISSCGISN
ncbi:unnamed protein product [Cuscuta epithymum]|uniref:Uncharacterized protein n=1 Tax=Cuscuta epithymum TaxID=186058 RepID=A0AAV0CJY4_9ASTE|nr:unnamed protein product [Cuscuta epithymum]